MKGEGFRLPPPKRDKLWPGKGVLQEVNREGEHVSRKVTNLEASRKKTKSLSAPKEHSFAEFGR
jgi:hypothetical protein